MREQWCRQQVDKIGEKCDLAPETVKEIKKVAGFVEEHPALASSSTKAIEPLMKIKDPVIKDKAISLAEKTLNRKTPTGGTIKKRLTKPEVEEIIEKVSPPETKKIIPASTSGSYQPGELTATNLPPQSSLTAQMKAKEPEFYNISEPAAAPKTQTQIKKEKAERLDLAVDAFLMLMPSSKTRNNIKEIMEKFPQFTAQADVIDMALDFMNGKWKP